jgi:hypothetical protein
LISLLDLKWKFKRQIIFSFLFLLIFDVILDILLQIFDKNLHIHLTLAQFELFQSIETFIAIFVVLISKILDFQTDLLIF